MMGLGRRAHESHVAMVLPRPSPETFGKDHRLGKGRLSFGFAVSRCPFCLSTEIRRDGVDNGSQRYRCRKCGRTFNALTGTMLADTRKRQREWEGFVLSLTNDATLVASSEYTPINKNTAYRWRIMVFSELDELVSGIFLYDMVVIDEIFFDVDKKDRLIKPNGDLPRGISTDKLAVEVAIDIHGQAYGKVMDRGHPDSGQILSALRGHVAPGSLVIHDDLRGYREAMKGLGVRDVVAKTKEPGSLGLMQPVNSLCALVRRVAYLHVGEKAKNLQLYVDWACLRTRLRSFPPKARKRLVLEMLAGKKFAI